MTTSPYDVLQRIRDAAAPKPGAVERCGMCSGVVPDDHDHVVDRESRGLICACRACWLLVTSDGAGAGRYRAVPDRYVALDEFGIPESRWAELQIPVSIAFFFENSSLGNVAAFYPGPAGVTESLLPLDAWGDLVAGNPLLGSLAPDVEALLVRVTREATEAFIVPVAACYELAGLLRQVWRGFDGGDDARDEIRRFFAEIRGRTA